MPRVLIIDDHDTMREGMCVTVQKSGSDAFGVRSGPEGLAAYRKSRFDLVITDLKMEQMDGIEVVRQLKQIDPDAVVMVVTGFGTIETAVAAMQQGAYDFITKPFTPDVLRAKVEQGLQIAGIRLQLQRVSAHNEILSGDAAAAAGSMVGRSEPIQRLIEQVRRAANSDATILIFGETGTGKELVARLVHELSPRKRGPFVVVHCAALAETLLESELFGHERGSFTGASRRKLGRFELADHGSLFLDEIGEISQSIQTKLLRVLQEKELQRVGGEQTIHVNVRVISATNRDLNAEVQSGRFREDLFYRLHVVPLRVPALRDRPDDIPLLAAHFVAKHAPRINRKVNGVSKAALRLLTLYGWPGNVRELENVIEQSLVFAEGEQIEATDLPPFHKMGPLSSSTARLPILRGDTSLSQIMEDVEAQLVLQAYDKCGRVKADTARFLGITIAKLYHKLEKYGLMEKSEEPSSDH